MKTKMLIASAMLLSVATAVGADHIFGVGLELSEGGENESPKIKSVLAGTPAATAGIKPGWTLLSVNGTNTAGKSLSECISLVRGEEGTWATLKLLDPDSPIRTSTSKRRTNTVGMTRVKIYIRESGAKPKTP
jgi:C-terminal processing protease CtpA/Prc